MCLLILAAVSAAALPRSERRRSSDRGGGAVGATRGVAGGVGELNFCVDGTRVVGGGGEEVRGEGGRGPAEGRDGGREFGREFLHRHQKHCHFLHLFQLLQQFQFLQRVHHH